MNFLFVFLLARVCLALVPPKDYVPDVFVLTDISNEPDDAESLVRLLLYTNEINLHGIVATTSYWLNYTTHEEDIHPIIDAYEKVRPQLLKHSESYPSADYLRSIVSRGHPVYGSDAFEQETLSDGARLLIEKVDALDGSRTMMVLTWGGSNPLAEALKLVKESRLAEEVAAFVGKLLVYVISDQDNTNVWIRYTFPKLRFVGSLHGFNQYGLSTWVGVSGEKYNPFDLGGPDSSLVSKEWLKKNIQSVSPLGEAYPDYMFIMEGDTPSTLFVLPNGLNYPLNPAYGGWGGRYTLVDNSGFLNHYADCTDFAKGLDGKVHVSNQATIWRWRDAYQGDFAARMQWTAKDFDSAYHQPIVVVNDTTSVLPYDLPVEVGSDVVLDASESYDLNDNTLEFKWFHYREVSVTQSNIIEIPEIDITPLNKAKSKVTFKVPEFLAACHNVFGRPLETCREYHIVLEVSNKGTRAYRRIVLKTHKGDRVFGETKWEQNFDANKAVHDEL